MTSKTTTSGKPKRKPTTSKRISFTLRSGGKALLTTPFEHVARTCAETVFNDLRSVSLIDNHAGRTIQHFIYGRPQR